MQSQKDKKYFDAHAHIAVYKDKYGDLNVLFKKLEKEGVSKVVDSGIDIYSSRKVLNLYKKFPQTIVPTVGLQPELLVPGSDIYKEGFDIDENILQLDELLNENRKIVKAVSECGLDYYWLEKGDRLSSKKIAVIKKIQKELYEKQIELALEYKLPLVIHSRGAEEKCLEILQIKRKAIGEKPNVLFHSFTGSLSVAKNVFEAGYFISFNGILTYSRAQEIRDIFEYAWENHKNQILFETDSPYLVPSNKPGKAWGHERGERLCVPSDVKYTIEFAGGLLGVDKMKVLGINRKNFVEFYGMK